MNRIEELGGLWETPSVSMAQNSIAEDRITATSIDALESVYRLNTEIEQSYKHLFHTEASLDRTLVSFQANKHRAVYRWFKYKEAFSAGLVEYLVNRFHLHSGVLLDPFAGSGTALFAASGLGLRAEGIELLPIGQQIIAAKQLIDSNLKCEDIRRLEEWSLKCPWRTEGPVRRVSELRITRGAYPPETIRAIGRFLAEVENEKECVRSMLRFALLCILEVVSYTRKDGQYLRWDYRSGRKQGSRPFDKGVILTFDKAIRQKLDEIVSDLRTGSADLFGTSLPESDVVLYEGSCLEILPTLNERSYDCLITSPPYCNRYDYTRTYALELAVLGVDEERLSKLRQNMLSCTVENRAKDLFSMNQNWQPAIHAADDQSLLQEMLSYLESQNELGMLNNTGIPRMVRGYFYEMACVIAESARVLKTGAPLLMVNDNVRYAGASISVDLIMSEIARKLGFDVEAILVLPNGKGNSSQQMGAHGREALRKCVYVWRRQ